MILLHVNNSAAQFHLQWKPPTNIANFDLLFYKLLIGNQTLTVHSDQDDEIFFVEAGVITDVSITAVNYCGQESEENNITLSSMIAPQCSPTNMASPLTFTSTSDNLGLGCVVMTVINMITIVTVAIIILIFTYWLYKKSEKHIKLKYLVKDPDPHVSSYIATYDYDHVFHISVQPLVFSFHFDRQHSVFFGNQFSILGHLSMLSYSEL